MSVFSIPSRARRPLGLAAALVAVGGLVACSSQLNGSVQLLTGGESDTFSRAPAPTTLIVDGIDQDGGTTELAHASLPADSVDLGERDQAAIYTVRVRAVDGAGKILVAGSSLPVQLGALEGATLPIFVQRVGELARMPGPVADARERPDVTLILGRYLLVTGGSTTPAQSQLYDLASLSPFELPPALPRTPKCVTAYGTRVLLVDEAGATWFELADSTSTAVTAPNGGSFAEIVGGRAIAAPDGSSYIVGATRTEGGATSRVLRIAKDASLSFASLTEPRLGAAAAWVPGKGLLVAGGSADGAGMELLPPDASAAVPLPFPADPVVGAGASALDASHLLLAGGVSPAGASAPTRVADLGCSMGCAPVTWPNLAIPLTSAQAFTLDPASALVVGDDASGASHLFTLRADAATEVPFKIGRHGARGAAVVGGAVVFTGGATTLEQYAP